MVAYDSLAAHYDAVTGDCATEAAFVNKIIRHDHGRTATLLEVACGTGGIIASLAAGYQVSGLDISPAMLAVARERLPDGTPLYLADMSSFNLGTTFDAIVCVYHGINHLLGFPDWEGFFDCAHRHLNDDGLLIFDVITIHNLEMMASSPRLVEQFGDNYLLIRVRASGEVCFDWSIEVFELQPSGKYVLIPEVIRTASFPQEKIQQALDERFAKVRAIASDGSVAAGDASLDRLWFVCAKAGRHDRAEGGDRAG
jgi:cyclopropane fatty-acyl-phospholipid synthase-like methyltransferase